MAPLILVLQMAKVASMSWYEAVCRACPGAQVYHLNLINPRLVSEIRALWAQTGPSQTVRNLALVRRGDGLPDPEFEGALHRARAGNQPIKIVSAIRDPIDRSISALFFWADFFGHRRLRLSHRDDPTVDSLLAYFVDSWRSALDGLTVADTFDQCLQWEFVRYRDWFEREITEVFSIGLEGIEFDFGECCLRARSGATELVCTRFEDLGGGLATRAVLNSVAATIGAPIEELPRVNATDNRRARDLYRAFRQQVKLPQDVIEAVYSPPILAKFYRSDEIQRMRRRWSAPRRTPAQAVA
ncbi:MAG: hypothetical protein WD036_08545 [Bauldia sp.]